MKRISLIISFILCALTLSAQSIIETPRTAYPWTFWYWMYGEVSDEGIVADLQAMKQAGIAGFYLMPIKGKSDIPKDEAGRPLYKGDSEQLSPEWWKRMQTVYDTAGELGLEIGIHFSDGFALGGGPWIKPEESMQKVTWSQTALNAETLKLAKKQPLALAAPPALENYYEDIRLVAYPNKYTDARTTEPTTMRTPGRITASDGSAVEFPFRSAEPCDIIFSYDEPFTLRSLRVVTGGNNYQAHRWKIYASEDGKDYKFVREVEPARQGWQNTDCQATYSIPETTARYFKFHWTPEGSDPGAEDMDAAKWKPNLKVAALELSSVPIIDGYEGKSGAVWRVSKEQKIGLELCLQRCEIINLTSYMKDGALDVKALPKSIKKLLSKGEWTLLRIGHTSTGHRNATGGGGKGLECDKFSKEAVNKQLENWFGQIYERLVSNKKTVNSRNVPSPKSFPLTRLHVDSWECGSQNWSSNFAEEFKARRGYDLMPWLPLFAGVPIESIEKSDAVLRDVRLTIGELINDIFFTAMEEGARRYGVTLSTECVAPTMVSDGLLHYQHADYPMGEFWLNSPTHDKPNDMLDAISGAHIYGKNIIQAEGFTEVRGTWDEHPAMLKQLLDRNYCLGINSIVFHVNTHNPYMDKKPGMTLDGIGTFFQRDNTWWREMPAFTDYITRCQTLLQYGRPVTDIAVYTGDEMPRRSILPQRLIKILPGLFSKADIEKENRRRANWGQPMEVSPVGVNHTKNMIKADQFTNPLRGYHYDSFNHDVLSTATVKDGKIVTRYGQEYEALVVPRGRIMNPNGINTCSEDIDRLRAAGAKIIDKLWTEEDLSSLGIPRDITLPAGLDYIHRKGRDFDIYFISNQTDKVVPLFKNEGYGKDGNDGDYCQSALSFRDTRSHAYQYDPLTNELTPYVCNRSLLPGASLFIIRADKALDCHQPTDKFAEQEVKAKTWNLAFEESGQQQVLHSLDHWTASDDPKVKYFSGHATYSSTFNFKADSKTAPVKQFLCLEGDLRDVATLKINGKACGTVWFPPYRFDITDALQQGENTIELTVVNTWANALLGTDLGMPPYEGIWTNGKYRRAEKDVIPAGFKGRLVIRSEFIQEK